MSVGLCEVCGDSGATRFHSDTVPAGPTGHWYHTLCLAKLEVTEATKLTWTKPLAKGYLAGMIDGEGHVRKDSGRTEITNNDIGIIAATKTAAEFLGIPTNVRVTAQKRGYAPTFAVCFLGGKETRKKLLKLPIVSKVKRDNLTKYA